MTDEADDWEQMRPIAEQLCAAIDETIGQWVMVAVASVAPGLSSEARIAAASCREAVANELAALFSTDLDAQSTTPLEILRRAARFPSAVLDAAGIDKPRRDPFDVRSNPDDLYGIAITTWSDLGPKVGEAGIMWGAAKAHLHAKRHRR